MSHKIGLSLIGIPSLMHNIESAIYEQRPMAWFEDTRSALKEATDALLSANETQPLEGWKLPGIAILYNTEGEVFGAFAPSFAETWCAHFGSLDGVIIPKNEYSDFAARIQSAINALNTHYFDGMQLVEPQLMSTTYENGVPIVFEHYGATHFNPEKVQVKTCAHLKPSGFWACHEDETKNWENFQQGKIWHTSRIEFALSESARILEINSLQDILYLQQHYPIEWSAAVEIHYPESFYDYKNLPRIMIDWSKVSQDYDGICYNYDALGNAFGPFDMNSISVFNPDVIEALSPPDIIRFPIMDDADVMAMLSEYILFDEQDYYEKLQFVADVMLSRIDERDTARENFYIELYNAAVQSAEAIETGEDPLLENWDYIEYLNHLSDVIRDEPGQDER